MTSNATVPGPVAPVPIVVLVSGSGTTLQALLDAAAGPGYGVRVAAVGADRDGIEGLARAQRAGVPTFVVRVADFGTRAAWDDALAAAVAAHHPRFVVGAGFMKLLGRPFLDRFITINTHPALLPAFPGTHGVRDALAYGVKVTGCTCHLVDDGIDTGPIIDQRAVPVRPGDTEDALHERIKLVERAMLVDVVGRMARDGFTVTDRKVTIP